MTPIEELLHQWADHVNGKAGPLGYPKQSVVQSIYTFRLDEGGTEGVVPLTAAGKQTRSVRGDRVPEWPDMVTTIDEAVLSLFETDRRAFYALTGYYLERVPGRLRQDEAGVSRGWRRLPRAASEGSLAYMERLARAMPWRVSKASLWAHKKRGQESVAAFLRGANWAA